MEKNAWIYYCHLFLVTYGLFQVRSEPEGEIRIIIELGLNIKPNLEDPAGETGAEAGPTPIVFLGTRSLSGWPLDTRGFSFLVADNPGKQINLTRGAKFLKTNKDYRSGDNLIRNEMWWNGNLMAKFLNYRIEIIWIFWIWKSTFSNYFNFLIQNSLSIDPTNTFRKVCSEIFVTANLYLIPFSVDKNRYKNISFNYLFSWS